MTPAENPVRNGVDSVTLFAILDAVKGRPHIAKFRFRATKTWVSGTGTGSTATAPAHAWTTRRPTPT